jgi:hypothetical protein
MPLRHHSIDADPDRWTNALRGLRGGPNPPARSMFSADTELAWEPGEDDLPHDELRFLLRWWQGLAAAHGGVPPATHKIDPLEVRPALGHLMILDAVDGGANFHFRLFGSVIANRAGFDMTGKLVTQMPTPPEIIAFFLATYRAASLERAPLYTESTPWSGISVTRWFRLVLPFAAADGSVQRLVVGNVPGANRLPSFELLNETALRDMIGAA